MRTSHSKDVEELLRQAGWHPGRRIDLSPWVTHGMKLFPAARRILAEFGGLVIGDNERGIDTARSDVDLLPKSYNRDRASESDLEREVGSRLFPIATVQSSNGELWIDEGGRVYLEGDFPDGAELWYMGPTFIDALEVLLLGKLPPSGPSQNLV